MYVFYLSKSSEVVVHSNDAFAPVAYLKFKELDIEPKSVQIPLAITLPDILNTSPPPITSLIEVIIHVIISESID
jgi:hypothetical protein